MATVWQTTSLCERASRSSGRVVESEGRARRRVLHTWFRRALLWLVGAGAILAAPCSGWSAGQAGPIDHAPGIASAPSAEVAFDAPRRFAALLEPSTKLQRLYAAGDIIPDAKGPDGEYQIKQIEKGGLQLGSLRRGEAVWIAVGGVIPGRAGWRVIGTPSLRVVEYRYVRTGGPLDTEPRVVELRDDRARLEVDMPLTVSGSPAIGAAVRATPMPTPPPPEAGRTFESTLLGRVRVKPTADDSYEINAADVNAARESGVQLLAEAWPKVWPSGSFRGGLGLDVQSPIADGTLGPRGFRVTSPNLAERGGVQVGDLIVGVNGQPVNGFADVYRVYRQMQRDRNLSLIQLDLVRQGQHLTKTYRIR